ncbi:hypothetical protein ASF89_00735 [Frigoribacterium sp. Leaf172]|nr:hypothetical protein ASF89_00735 [Frigoribacterium sp. Leaf172]
MDDEYPLAYPELPQVAGDTALFDSGEGRFVIACVGADVWSVRRMRDPLYLGELRRVGALFDYKAKAGTVPISM